MSAQLDTLLVASNLTTDDSTEKSFKLPACAASLEKKPVLSQSSLLSSAGQGLLMEPRALVDDIMLGLGPKTCGAIEKVFPGALDRVARICSVRISELVDQANVSMQQRVMMGLRGVGSASAVVTTDSVFYLPMDTAPRGQKLIALGPGGCGVFEQITNKNKEDYYGWFPMPKIPDDNPIRVQYRF